MGLAGRRRLAKAGAGLVPMKKIIYLLDQPLDSRNLERFGIARWNARGWLVEVWDLTPLIQPQVWQDFCLAGGMLERNEYYFQIDSKADLDVRVKCLRSEDYLIDLSGDSMSLVLLKGRVAKAGTVRVVCATGTIPSPPPTRSKWSKLKNISSLGQLLVAVSNRLAARLAAANPPGLYVVSGSLSVPSGIPEGQIVRAHNLDYDRYLELRTLVSTRSAPFAVFIDQDYCDHYEYITQGSKRVVTADQYYPSICNGLRRIGKALNVRLHVAAHPRRKGQPLQFEDIPLSFGGTAELIRDCSVVVGHDSTAVQMAVLFQKPVIFVTTNQINRTYFDGSFKKESLAHFASELGKAVINLDEDLDQIDWRKELVVNQEKYTGYREKYIKMSGTPDRCSWDIVIDVIDAHIVCKEGRTCQQST
jgi:hypothetical protein